MLQQYHLNFLEKPNSKRDGMRIRACFSQKSEVRNPRNWCEEKKSGILQEKGEFVPQRLRVISFSGHGMNFLAKLINATFCFVRIRLTLIALISL